MKRFIIVLLIVLLLPPSSMMAAEEVELGQVVVTATRTEEVVESVPLSVTVITADDMEKKQVTTVLEVLRDVKGLDVVRSGGPGKSTAVFIRGGNAGHTLVMIDGVQVNSPTLGQFNFADLTVNNIDKIEIIRGPHSTLYGSDAMAGVVNIITKKGKGAPEFSISAERGSFDTQREVASLFGGTDKVSYSLSVSEMDTDGISVTAEDEGNKEEDGYESRTISGRLGYRINENMDVDIMLRHTDSETDLDGIGGDDLNYTQDSDSLVMSAKLNHLVNDIWDYSLKLSLFDDDLKNRDPDPFGVNSDIETETKTADLQHNIYLFDEKSTLTFGFEYEEQEGKSDSGGGVFDKRLINRAFYLQEQLEFLNDRAILLAGIRRDKQSQFKGETTYRLAGSYLLKNSQTRFRASYGTAYKAPTFNDLFWPYQADVWFGTTYITEGNQNLKPERGDGYDVGLTQHFWEDRLSLDITYFSNTFKNLIDWNSTQTAPTEFTYQPVNVDDATMKGWEFGLTVKPTDIFHIDGSYTRTKTEDKATGKELDRRPKNKAFVSASWSPGKANVTVSYNYVGHKWDKDHTVKLDSYGKTDLAASYDLTKKIQIFGRIENLNNRSYTEAMSTATTSFGTAGRSYYAGVKATF